jgi:hypothetical protein
VGSRVRKVEGKDAAEAHVFDLCMRLALGVQQSLTRLQSQHMSPIHCMCPSGLYL